eukprot:974884-Pyramimonas_sp.AAC.1
MASSRSSLSELSCTPAASSWSRPVSASSSPTLIRGPAKASFSDSPSSFGACTRSSSTGIATPSVRLLLLTPAGGFTTDESWGRRSRVGHEGAGADRRACRLGAAGRRAVA